MAKDTTKIALAKLHKMAALNPDTTAKATEKDSISSQGSADADMRAREKHSGVKYDTLPTGDELEPTNTENSVGYQNARDAQMSAFGTNEALIGDGVQGEYLGQEENHHEMPRFPGIGGEDVVDEPVGTYKVYKRRWFGLVQLALLNIVTSWDWITFAPVSTTSSEYFGVGTAAINWLSISSLFVFIPAAPACIWVLHHKGPKTAIIIAAVFTLAGNWIRYAGAKTNNFGVLMFGQILTGIAQPFALCAPTRYSDIWFTGGGRVAATALTSLSNPFGAAVGQFVDPILATDASQIPNMVLWVAVISSIASIPSFFIPAKPPTPCSHSQTIEKVQSIRESFRLLFSSLEFYLVAFPFAIFVGLFSSFSSVINEVLEPHGYSETQAGIAGGVLILAGLISAAITSPIIDRVKGHLLISKIVVPITALSYLAFIFTPQTGTVAAPYVVLAIMGATSFSLMPVALEYQVEITHPVSPEITTTLCWTVGQLFAALMILVDTAILEARLGDRVLWMQAIIAICVVPCTLSLGLFGRRKQVALRRHEADKIVNEEYARRIESNDAQA